MPASTQIVDNYMEEDARNQTRNITGTFLREDIPRPGGDPFEHILKPMFERESKQCDAWKDEVQNILIFSGLFSAIVTAFIIESYKRLQPDPNDAIISLLSSIANHMNSTTASTAGQSPEFFNPSPSDIRINVFWFISLVLSLTVALIGVVSLQWLREHQRYDSRLEPSKVFAIFNARSEGLRRWYVPHIFAGLPLLLQAALVLFLAGIIDLLFAHQKQVAIPVTIVAGIPSVFLLATTVFPTMQMYTMRLPYLLSVNYNVPAPCPYKSPQSLIFRRITHFFDSIFGNGAWAFAIFYIPIAGVRRFIQDLSFYPICGRRQPSPQAISPFKGAADPWFKSSQIKLTSSSGDWIMADDYWLAARTSYAVITKTPDDFRGSRIDRSFAFKSSVTPTFYDTVKGIQMAAYGTHSSDTYTNALYHAGGALIDNQLKSWLKDVSSSAAKIDTRQLLMRGRCISLMAILAPKGAMHSTYSPNDYSEIQPSSLLPNLDYLRSAYEAALLQRFLAWNSIESIGIANILHRWDESHIQMIYRRLIGDPEELFKCTSTFKLAPEWFLNRPAHYRNLITHHTTVESRRRASSRWTEILKSFVMKSLALPPWTSSCPHIQAPTTRGQCESNFFYENVDNLVRYIIAFQTDDDVIRMLGLLKDLCQATGDPVKDRPFVAVIACTYINATTMVELHKVKEFNALFRVLYSVCGAPSRILRPGDTEYAWEGLRFSLEYIRSYQVQIEPVQALGGSQHGREDGLQDLGATPVFISFAASDIV